MSDDPLKPKCPGCDSDLSPGAFTCAKCGHATMWPVMGYATLVALLMVAPLLLFPAHGFLRILEWVLSVPGFLILAAAVFLSCEFLHVRARLSRERTRPIREGKRKVQYRVIRVPTGPVLDEDRWGGVVWGQTHGFGATFPPFCVQCCRPADGWGNAKISQSRHGYKSVHEFTLQLKVPFCSTHLAEYEATIFKTKGVRGFKLDLYSDGATFRFGNPDYGRLFCDHNPDAQALTAWEAFCS